MKARGNRIGSITDLKTSCLASGRPDLAYKLVEQLQNALDSLKHRVEIDESVISDIRKEVSPAPWLRYKRERRVSDLPLHLDVADTDKVGRLYNVLRKELGDILNERMAVEDFRGIFSGHTVTKEMFEECQLVNAIYGDVAAQITVLQQTRFERFCCGSRGDSSNERSHCRRKDVLQSMRQKLHERGSVDPLLSTGKVEQA